MISWRGSCKRIHADDKLSVSLSRQVIAINPWSSREFIIKLAYKSINRSYVFSMWKCARYRVCYLLWVISRNYHSVGMVMGYSMKLRRYLIISLWGDVRLVLSLDDWYLIKWVNYPIEQSTWEPYYNLKHLKSELLAFKNQHKKTKRSKPRTANKTKVIKKKRKITDKISP